jgi:hypothetical protein
MSTNEPITLTPEIMARNEKEFWERNGPALEAACDKVRDVFWADWAKRYLPDLPAEQSAPKE